jgi:hypothetical protein
VTCHCVAVIYEVKLTAVGVSDIWLSQSNPSFF